MHYLTATDPFATAANNFLRLLEPVMNVVTPTEQLRELNRASRSINQDMQLVASTYYRLLVGISTIHSLHAAQAAVVELLSGPLPAGGYAALYEQLHPHFAGLLGTTEPEHFDELATLAALGSQIKGRTSFYKQLHQRHPLEAARKASSDPKVAPLLEPFLAVIMRLSSLAWFYQELRPNPERLPELLARLH